MIFLLFIGTRRLHVFDLNENCERIYIDGKDCYEYDITKASEDVEALLEYLVNEYNLSSKAEVKFQVLTNTDKGINDIMSRALGNHVQGRFSGMEIIKKAIKELSKDKNYLIDDYGINFDGNCYKLKGEIVKKDFSLLAYTLCDELLLNLIRYNRCSK